MYKQVFFEISGKCNALCPWCYTGQKNRNSNNRGTSISPEKFEKAIGYMIDNNIINKSSIINMFNWGEPFLNPHFKDIINILNKYEIKYTLSTNASKVIKFSEDNILKNLDLIIFSMPGFSQYSYDKIHSFNFEKIKSNIIEIVDNFRKCGFKGMAKISYHVYQFNLAELEDAYEFAYQNNIYIQPSYAFFNGLKMFKNYLKSEMTYEELKKASQELILYYISDKIKEKPENYKCPQFEILTIDEKCNVLTCCGVGEDTGDYSIGNLFDLSLNEIKELKVTRDVCKECDELGLNYIGGNPQIHILTNPYKYKIMKLVLENLFNDAKGKNIGIYGTGAHTNKMLQVYKELFGSFKFNLFFIDSSKEKWGKSYYDSLIHNPKDIESLNLDQIIISSYTFQEEMYSQIKHLEKAGMKIIKIYNQNDELLFK